MEEWLKGRLSSLMGRVQPYQRKRGRSAQNPCARQFRLGAVLVWVAITIIVVLGIVGMSMDWGKLALNLHQLQNAADAGALAGAQYVKLDVAEAREKAMDVAFWNPAENLPVSVAENPDNDIDGELVVGRWIRQERYFLETVVAPSAVKVVARRRGQRDNAPELKLIFGPAFGTSRAGASRYAIAWSQGSSGSAIICLAEDPSTLPDWQNKGTGLRLPGTARVDLRGINAVTGEPMIGDIQVNAVAEKPPWTALRVDGVSTSVNSGELNVVGQTNPDADDAEAWAQLFADPTEPFSVNPTSSPLADPLADIEPPDISTMTKQDYPPGSGKFNTVSGVDGTVITLNPGYYPGGINTDSGTIVLNEGVYAFGGGNNPAQPAGLVVGDDGAVIGMGGVMVYITGDPEGSLTGTKTQYGRVSLGGNAHVELTSPGDLSPSDAIGVDGESGIVMWQDRNNPNHAYVMGTSESMVEGTLYFGYNAVTLGGTPSQMGNQILAGALEVHGTSDLRIAYDGRNAIVARRAILVE